MAINGTNSHRITSIQAVPEERKIKITWDGGKITTTASFNDLIKSMPEFGSGDFLTMAERGRGGLSIVWPGQFYMRAADLYANITVGSSYFHTTNIEDHLEYDDTHLDYPNTQPGRGELPGQEIHYAAPKL